MSKTTIFNSYDDTKKMLNKIREIQSMSKNKYEIIQEQIDSDDNKHLSQNETSEDEDFAVINNVEIEIHSEDPEDMELSDEEKGKISQLIDDFRSEVSETVMFDKLHLYSGSAKLDGKLPDINLEFTFSTGDDTGLYLSNASLLKIDDTSLTMINKLKNFGNKFSSAINGLIVNRTNN